MASCEGIPKIQTHDLTPRDDTRKTVSEVLKRVDILIRKGELDQAELGVTQAREIDPKNIYAYAFLERISVLKQQAHQNSLATDACKTAEEVNRRESGILQTRQLPQQKEQSRIQPGQQIGPRPISPPQPTTSAKMDVDSTQNLKTISLGNKTIIHPNEWPVGQEIPMETSRENKPQAADTQRKSEEERSQKIREMVKTAVETARKEAEQKQMEIRAREQEELARKEDMRIREAAEAARKAEEQKQTDLRRKSEEHLQQKIKETLRRRLGSAAAEHAVEQVSSSIPPSISTPNIQASVLTPNEVPVSPDRLETLARYKLVLSSVWADGAVSEEETITLKQLRHALSISTEEHVRLEKEVQRDTYVEAFKKAWNSGTITPENASVLAELRHRFKISSEEHLTIESRILWEIQPVKNRPTLLVIDDDERLLKAVSKTLNDAGFITTPVTTSDEAYAYLKDSSPDLILCDVNLETSTMGGFAFYEKVRELERLREIPFIFLSGLSDEALVRTGKELGADDYLSKPISEETLVATIKGKLRRYQDFRKRMN